MPICKSCGAPIVWIKTIAGKDMPADETITAIVTDNGATVRGHLLHWATCPDSAYHRKVKQPSAGDK